MIPIQLPGFLIPRLSVLSIGKRLYRARSLAAVQRLHPGYTFRPLLSPPPTGCQPWIVFWCFFRRTIELHSQQPKQTFVDSYASGHFVSPSRPPPLSLSTVPSPVLTPPLHSVTATSMRIWVATSPPAVSGVTCDYHYLSNSLRLGCIVGLSRPLALHTTVNICTQSWTVESFHGGESLHYMKYSGRAETPVRPSAGFLLRFDYTTWFFHELWQSCWIRVSPESLW